MKDGRFLEMLVECLQKLLADEAMKVTRNKEFYSRGKKIGEVDVVLCGKLESMDLMLGIECRDRGKPQGRSWIREIIGKREDLAEFGFNYWVAVSASGFRSTAEQLAKKAKITLLVPGETKPIDPAIDGPHNWMNLGRVDSFWELINFTARIEHDSDEILDQLTDQLEGKSQNKITVSTANKELIPLRDFIKLEAETKLNDYASTTSGSDFRHTQTLTFSDLQGNLDGVDFRFLELKVELVLHRITTAPQFRMMAFVIPGTQIILGIIGINEYTVRGNKTYLMVAMKPNDIKNFIMVFRDSEGNPLPTHNIQLLMPTYHPDTALMPVTFSIKP